MDYTCNIVRAYEMCEQNNRASTHRGYMESSWGLGFPFVACGKIEAQRAAVRGFFYRRGSSAESAVACFLLFARSVDV